MMAKLSIRQKARYNDVTYLTMRTFSIVRIIFLTWASLTPTITCITSLSLQNYTSTMPIENAALMVKQFDRMFSAIVPSAEIWK